MEKDEMRKAIKAKRLSQKSDDRRGGESRRQESDVRGGGAAREP